MKNLVEQAKSEIRNGILFAVKKAQDSDQLPKEAELPDFTVEIPADVKNGDFATNAAMVSARVFKMPPVRIAAVLAEHFPLEDSMFASCSVAGPGFLNFVLAPVWFSSVLQAVFEEQENYGTTNLGEGKKILVEFVSANPTGPMHIGNARGGALGDCLASVLSAAGYEVDREFYVNDAGNQIAKFGLSLDLRYQECCGLEIEMPEDSYHGQDIVEHAKNFYAVHQDAYMSSDESERRAALVAFALPKNVQTLHDDLEKYRITYDKWFYESEVHNNGEVARVISLLKESGYTYEKDDALWFKAEQFGCEKDYVLIRSNGLPTYVVPDIAYHYNKLVTRGYDRAIDVLGADHHGYVPRLKAALQALGVDPSRLDAVLMQMVRLVRDGEVVKASKRSGKAITLAVLLDEVPIDAARFYFNLREANSHFDFDLDLAVEQSSQNPVYYVQYAHARICSILKHLEEEGITPLPVSEEIFNLLREPEELALIRHISLLPDEINDAAKDYDPSLMTKYLTDLATCFHKFYNACKCNCGEVSLTSARLYLCKATRQVLENVLKMLKINAPEHM